MKVKPFYLWLLFSFIVFLFLLILFMTYSYGHGDHDWIKKYKGKDFMPCCGVQDCIRVRLRIVGETPTTYDFEMNERVIIRNIPKRGYHASEDGDDWFCFIPQGSFDPAGAYSSPEDDACAQNPTTKCSNCFFIAPKM